jgi:hypothetical protein
MGGRRTQNLELISVKLGREYYHLYRDLTIWCEKKFGTGDWGEPSADNLWGNEIIFGTTYFYFRNESDAIIFSLRWL